MISSQRGIVFRSCSFLICGTSFISHVAIIAYSFFHTAHLRYYYSLSLNRVTSTLAYIIAYSHSDFTPVVIR